MVTDIRITVDRAVVDEEFERVAAGVIDAEGRGGAGWIIEAGCAVGGFAQKAPAEGQWVVVDVAVSFWEGGSPHLQVTPSGGLGDDGGYVYLPSSGPYRL